MKNRFSYTSTAQYALLGFAAYVGMRDIALPELISYADTIRQLQGLDPIALSDDGRRIFTHLVSIPSLALDCAREMYWATRATGAMVRRNALILRQKKERHEQGFDLEELTQEDILGARAQEAEHLQGSADIATQKMNSSFMWEACCATMGYVLGGAILEYIRAAADTGQWNV